MTTALEPDLALAYLRELSADLRAAIVLGAAGERLAGERGLHGPAGALLGAHPHARELHGTAGDGAQVFAIRAERHAIVVVTGPHALPRLTRRDMRTVASVWAIEHEQDFLSGPQGEALVEALATAAADAFRPQTVVSPAE